MITPLYLTEMNSKYYLNRPAFVIVGIPLAGILVSVARAEGTRKGRPYGDKNATAS